MKQIGEQHSKAKLRASDIPRIRARCLDGHGCIARLAREYGVDWTTIARIRDGLNWKSVPE